jgi:hypothetical protein
MLRVEETDDGAEYVVLYVSGDDPIRSLLRCRWALIAPWFAQRAREQGLFHSNPSAHVEMDLDSGSFVELDSLLSTPESLYAICDPEWMVEHLRDDVAAQLAAYAGSPDMCTSRNTSQSAGRIART